jgi:hypothetical protein
MSNVDEAARCIQELNGVVCLLCILEWDVDADFVCRNSTGDESVLIIL